MDNGMIANIEDLERLIAHRGFLPFFFSGIPYFSLDYYTPQELWFPDEGMGVWDWKGPSIIEGGFAYGKFFDGKAGWISMDWFPDFVNYRRSISKLSEQEKVILSTIEEHQSLLSKELKKLCGYVKPRRQVERNPLLKLSQMAEKELKAAHPKRTKGKEGFDTAITKLQMATYVVTADFEYNYDKQGRRYGWGVARYCTPEDFFGRENFSQLKRTPAESHERIFRHLRKLLPQASEQQILKIIG